MKKIGLLFIIAVLATSTALAACGGNPVQEDFIVLISYTNGRIKLAQNASVIDTENISFNIDEKELNPKDLPTDKWVSFKKIDSSQAGFFIVKTDRHKSGKKIESTHVQLAKQGQDSSSCPHWAKDIFGNYCQSDVLSVY